MLTRFFSKSKPINFLVTIILISTIVIVNVLWNGETPTSFLDIGYWVLIWLGFIFSMFLVDFISRKNDLTKNTTYKVFLFVVFLGVFPNTFLTTGPFLSNLFVLLALRRIISLRTKKETFKKTFDAALWLSVACLFWFWSIVFFAVLYVGIFYYRKHRYKEFIIPLAGIGTVFMLTTVYHLLLANTLFSFNTLYAPISTDVIAYTDDSLLIPFLGVFVVFLVAFVDYTLQFKKRKKNKEKNRLLYTIVGVSLAVAVLAPQKNGSELVFFALPFCVIVANFLETNRIILLKEAILWSMLVFAVINWL